MRVAKVGAWGGPGPVKLTPPFLDVGHRPPPPPALRTPPSLCGDARGRQVNTRLESLDSPPRLGWGSVLSHGMAVVGGSVLLQLVVGCGWRLEGARAS